MRCREPRTAIDLAHAGAVVSRLDPALRDTDAGLPAPDQWTDDDFGRHLLELNPWGLFASEWHMTTPFRECSGNSWKAPKSLRYSTYT